MEYALAGVALALFLLIAFRSVIKSVIQPNGEAYDSAADDEFQEIIAREKEMMRRTRDEKL